MKRKVLKAAPREPFPFLALLLLIVTVGLFWVLPGQMESRPVRVDFAKGR